MHNFKKISSLLWLLLFPDENILNDFVYVFGNIARLHKLNNMKTKFLERKTYRLNIIDVGVISSEMKERLLPLQVMEKKVAKRM